MTALKALCRSMIRGARRTVARLVRYRDADVLDQSEHALFMDMHRLAGLFFCAAAYAGGSTPAAAKIVILVLLGHAGSRLAEYLLHH